jgi:hypothetical protein
MAKSFTALNMKIHPHFEGRGFPLLELDSVVQRWPRILPFRMLKFFMFLPALSTSFHVIYPTRCSPLSQNEVLLHQGPRYTVRLSRSQEITRIFSLHNRDQSWNYRSVISTQCFANVCWCVRCLHFVWIGYINPYLG